MNKTIYECADCGKEFSDGEARDNHFMSAACPTYNPQPKLALSVIEALKTMKKTQKSKRAFTLIELMVVIAIIGILAAMLVPAITQFKHKSDASGNRQQVQEEHNRYEYRTNVYQSDATNGLPTH